MTLAGLKQKFKSMLAVLNADPKKGAVRYRRVVVGSEPTIPQGNRERQRRIRQIINGQIPFKQLGGDPLLTYGEALKEYRPGLEKKGRAA